MIFDTKYTKEILQENISKTNSLRQLILSFGLTTNGSGHYRQFKKLIAYYEIDTSHWGCSIHRNTKRKNLSLKELLTIRPYQVKGNYLKQRLIDEGYFQPICHNCSHQAHWQGKPLTLQLDHINGNFLDNRLENLRLLCPNCHSQTDTYTSRSQLPTG